MFTYVRNNNKITFKFPELIIVQENGVRKGGYARGCASLSVFVASFMINLHATTSSVAAKSRAKGAPKQ
jgi:hypothetical protein